MLSAPNEKDTNDLIISRKEIVRSHTSRQFLALQIAVLFSHRSGSRNLLGLEYEILGLISNFRISMQVFLFLLFDSIHAMNKSFHNLHSGNKRN